MTAPTTKHDNSDNPSLEKAIWNDPALVEALRRTPSNKSVQNITSLTPKRRTWIWAGALAASVCVTLIAWPLLYSSGNPNSTPRPVAAPQQFAAIEATDVILSDGSEVALNRQAVLQFTKSSSRRNAMLTKGEAYFAVKRDEERPFIVATGTARIEVLGTAFNVDKTLHYTTVEVFHGKVAVMSATSKRQVELVKGQRARLDSNGITVSQFSSAKPDWQLGWLDLNNVTINDAIYQLNRYADKPVLLQQVDQNIRVSGWFKTADIAGAATLIAQMNGLSVTTTEAGIILSPDKKL